MHVDTWDIWERAETGPICPAKDFDLKVVAAKTRELVKKYEVKYDPDQVVPTDDDLIDRIYEAGLELLAETGVLCADTEKIIQFTREEIEETLDLYPGRVMLGEGREAGEWVHRSIEDSRKPRIVGGMVAGAVSEDIMPRVYEAYARETALDVFAPGTPSTVRGKVVKPGTPLEMYAEKVHVSTIREAFRRAGRPGVALTGTHYIADLAPVSALQPRYYRQSDCLILVLEVQLKANLGKLSLAEAIHDYGARYFGTGTGFIGGLFGGPEGATIGLVAETLAAYLVYRPDLCGVFAADMIYGPGTNDRKPLWISTHAQAALAKNTKLVWQTTSPYACHAGAGTEMYFREMAAGTIATVPCGGNPAHGSGGDGIGLDSFGGPLDTRFVRDVAYASTKLARADANAIVQALLAKNEPRVNARDPEKGKTFQELNDLDTLQPTPEHMALQEQMKKELEDLGLDFSESRAPDMAGAVS